MCVAANAAVLECVNTILTESGWSFEAVTVATLDIGVAIARARRSRGISTVVVRLGTRLDIVSMRGLQPQGIRSISTSIGEEAVLDALLSGANGTTHGGASLKLLFGGIDVKSVRETGPQRSELQTALRRMPDSANPFVLCSSQAIEGIPLDLLPHTAAQRQLRRQVTVATRNIAIGVVLVVLGFGIRRQEQATQAKSDRAMRGQFARKVANAVARRDSANDLRSRIASVARAEEKWHDRSAILTALASMLPADASLSTMRVIGDTILMSGVARNAEHVLVLLQSDSLFGQSAFFGPIEQFGQPDETVLERFTIRTRLSRRVAESARSLARNLEQ